MANAIDLKKLREILREGITPEHELPRAEEEDLLTSETETQPEEVYRDLPNQPAFHNRGESLLAWEAWEFETHEAGPLNLFVLGSLLILGGIVTAFFKNFLFALFLAIAGGLTIHHAFREAKEISCAVTSVGVRVSERLYEFQSLQSFWIAYDPPFSKELVLHSQKTVMPLIKVPLGEIDPLHLREILLRFLSEEQHQESLPDILAKWIGF